MNIAPINPTLQALNNAQDVGHIRAGAAAPPAQTAQAVGEVVKIEASKEEEFRLKPEPEDYDAPPSQAARSQGKRGGMVDIKV